jgi:hypothetical protein
MRVKDMENCMQAFGRYNTAAEAGRAYDVGSILYHGAEVLNLNFDKEEYLDEQGHIRRDRDDMLPGALADSIDTFVEKGAKGWRDPGARDARRQSMSRFFVADEQTGALTPRHQAFVDTAGIPDP